MEYFSQDAAIKTQGDLMKFKGQMMRFSEAEELDKVQNIMIQKTDYEIANYGNVEHGYYVIILFEKQPALTPSEFSRFNALQPIYGTHREITHGIKNQLITNKAMYGSWHGENEGNLIDVRITTNTITIKGNVNGKEINETLEMGGHWNGEYAYCITSYQVYVIAFANETEMGFVKLKNQGVIDGNYVWQFRLKRIK